MEEIKRDVEKKVEEIQILYERTKLLYTYIKANINELCAKAHKGLYVSQDFFEEILDILLSFGLTVDIKNEFVLMISAYYFIYPDSVKIYHDKLFNMFKEQEDKEL